eukprot:TRINITY_DN15143_c1_g1_i1.p1 TRINITY_DN15143_c1_g1~~TRINITY_DN15143_c1_g1_i1.p1  ORF type:complete len:551 (-),score=114.05 TRINITY_DN15143_c1_g1_i1:144-1796(-)
MSQPFKCMHKYTTNATNNNDDDNDEYNTTNNKMLPSSPLHEEWSPELLSELQRAVPVLESGTFDLEDDEDAADFEDNMAGAGAGAGWLPGDVPRDWPTNCRTDSGLQWSGWATNGGHNLVARARNAADGGSGSISGAPSASLPADLLSDNAMALPMSTLTSGKRKTYPNKSTFQAHVCCVMDPLQVPRVLESLQSTSQFRSVRSWPYAYRIISPFDGQVHEGGDDDTDAGAGDKMLGLLKRMGLENLLLIISRWDTGTSNRLGSELFKCVNEQCKDLLKELQQAVVASIPPEELMLRNTTPTSASSQHQDGYGEDDCSGSYPNLLVDSADPYQDNSVDPSWQHGDELQGYVAVPTRHIDPGALGATPPPLEQVWQSRSAAAPPSKRHAPTRSTSTVLMDGPVSPPGLSVQRCSVLARVPGGSQHQGSSRDVGSSTTPSSQAYHAEHSSGFFITEQPDSVEHGIESGQLDALPTEDLLSLASRLRSERSDLEGALSKLNNAEEVIKSIRLPIFNCQGRRETSKAPVAIIAQSPSAPETQRRSPRRNRTSPN